MKTEHVVSTAVEDVSAMISNVPVDENDDWNWETLEGITHEEFLDLAKRFKVSPVILNAFRDFCTSLRDAVKDDLTDIWRRLDAMENKD